MKRDLSCDPAASNCTANNYILMKHSKLVKISSERGFKGPIMIPTARFVGEFIFHISYVCFTFERRRM